MTLAFDWGARAELQEALAGIAESADFSTASGMMKGATRTVRLLAKHIGAARYGIYERANGSAADAEGIFHKRTLGLRARFTDELVRNRERQEGPELRAGVHEGEGFVTISVVAGSMVHLAALAAAATPEAFVEALLAVTGLDRSELVAFEVVWSPAAEDDRMSSHELETLYPELLRFDDDAGIGTVQCTHCAAPYPAEIERCHVCGAPRP